MKRALSRAVAYPILWFVEWAAPRYRDHDPERVDRILARAAVVRARLRDGSA